MSHYTCSCGHPLRRVKSIRRDALTQEHRYQCRGCRTIFTSTEILQATPTPYKKVPRLLQPKYSRTNKGQQESLSEDTLPEPEIFVPKRPD